MPALYLKATRSTVLGHGGLREEVSYSVFLNSFCVNSFSSTYCGSAARQYAEKYAQGLSKALDTPIIKVRSK